MSLESNNYFDFYTAVSMNSNSSSSGLALALKTDYLEDFCSEYVCECKIVLLSFSSLWI